MNRSTAIRRVDELLAWQAQEMVEGVCPQCGVVGEAMGHAPAGWQEKLGVAASNPVTGRRFTHVDQCPLADANSVVVALCNRHRLRLEQVFLDTDAGVMLVNRRAEQH